MAPIAPHSITEAAEQAFLDGVLAHAGGDAAGAEAAYRRVLGHAPDHAGALHHLALVLLQQNQAEEAATLARATLARQELPPLWAVLGEALHRLGRPAEALPALERAVALAPGDAGPAKLIGLVLLGLGRPAEAMARFAPLVEADPGDADAQAKLGTALYGLGRDEEALACIRLAETLAPAEPEIPFNIGVIQAERGALDEAVAAFDRAIALGPHVPRYYRARSIFGLDPEHVAALEAMDPAALPAVERIERHFALGRACDRAGAVEPAMAHWQEGNRLERAGIDYDEAATLALFDHIRASFTPELLRRVGNGATGPVFIIGMMRSGSTLIEQILASHPAIFGAGETGDFAAALAELPESGTYPEDVASWPDAALEAIAAGYRRRLAGHAPAASIVTDKTLDNFLHLGLIHLALPGARFIHARRDPVDTCLSCFGLRFTHPYPFRHDLAELGRYYRAYQGLMAHWRAVLPEGSMLEVDYEALIADPEGQSRRMVSFLGLDWNPACLDFHKTRRAVRTSSLAAVRRPVYRNAVGRSGAYRPYLGALLDALDGK